MPEGMITTKTFCATADNRAVEVIASLDAGEIKPGMFIHIPLNGMVDFTVPIAAISPLAEGFIRLILDCGDEDDGADLVLAFNFENETLYVRDTGEA